MPLLAVVVAAAVVVVVVVVVAAAAAAADVATSSVVDPVITNSRNSKIRNENEMDVQVSQPADLVFIKKDATTYNGARTALSYNVRVTQPSPLCGIANKRQPSGCVLNVKWSMWTIAVYRQTSSLSGLTWFAVAWL